MSLREAAQQALEALEEQYSGPLRDKAMDALRAALESDDTEMLLRQHRFEIGRLRAALAELQQESTPIYLAEVTMPEPLAGGYIVDDCLWCSGAAWCLECRHEWVAVWPLAAESLECPACGSTDTDRDQAGPHKRKGEQHD